MIKKNVSERVHMAFNKPKYNYQYFRLQEMVVKTRVYSKIVNGYIVPKGKIYLEMRVGNNTVTKYAL